MRRALLAVAAVLVGSLSAVAAEVTGPHVRVSYEGVDENQAHAIADTIAAARKVYVEGFGFDMPETVRGSVECGEGKPTRLFTDGSDSLFLSVPTKETLDRPAMTGVFNLYGMCHELGHMAMYRLIKDHGWMTTAGAEGWAHYAGSVVVDDVYAAEGEKLWRHDPYDYRPEGIVRVKRQLRSSPPDAVARGAGLWMELDEAIGRKGFPVLFAAWGAADVEGAADVVKLLGDAAVKALPEEAAALEKWWAKASPVFVEKRQASGVQKQTLPESKLAHKPVTLKGDDDTADGKRSIAGSGHARTFETPDDGGEYYLTAVHVHCARYGPSRAPATDYTVTLCDSDLKPIASWKKPYAAAPYGGSKWLKIGIPPTKVPKSFAVCVNYNPTARNGVYVSHDTSTTGHSFTGLPGQEKEKLEKGDWMIRVDLDRPVAAPGK